MHLSIGNSQKRMMIHLVLLLMVLLVLDYHTAEGAIAGTNCLESLQDLCADVNTPSLAKKKGPHMSTCVGKGFIKGRAGSWMGHSQSGGNEKSEDNGSILVQKSID
jgi:hypothetical protein